VTWHLEGGGDFLEAKFCCRGLDLQTSTDPLPLLRICGVPLLPTKELSVRGFVVTDLHNV